MYLIFKILIIALGVFPVSLRLALARALARAYYQFDVKGRRKAYHNLRLALSSRFSPFELDKILKSHYLKLSQNLVEVLFMSRINREYLNKYIDIEAAEEFKQAVKEHKNAVFTCAHFGNWEMLNVIAKALFPERNYAVMAKEQSSGKLAELLGSYRKAHGLTVISSDKKGLRQAVDLLSSNGIVAMVMDQGMGDSRETVEFLGRTVFFPTGVFKLARKFDAPVFLANFVRIKGPYLKLKVLGPFFFKKEEPESEFKEKILAFHKLLEQIIIDCPDEYLWSFKRFKQKQDVLLLGLSDLKPGHQNQTQSFLTLLQASLKEKYPLIKTVQLNLKSPALAGFMFNMLVFVKWRQLSLKLAQIIWGRKFLELFSICPDYIVSAGSHVEALNILVGRENSSKRVLLMKPAWFNQKSFDLIVSGEHDRAGENQNTVFIPGALNRINQEALLEQAAQFKAKFRIDNENRLMIGLLMGGDSRRLHFDLDKLSKILDEMISSARTVDAGLLVSTSRRTSRSIEQLIKQKLSDFKNPKALVIANEDNVSYAVGGILAIADLVLVSGESISMVSEAACAGKYILVFSPENNKSFFSKSLKHEKFLSSMIEKGYVRDAGTNCRELILKILNERPDIKKLSHKQLLENAFLRLEKA